MDCILAATTDVPVLLFPLFLLLLIAVGATSQATSGEDNPRRQEIMEACWGAWAASMVMTLVALANTVLVIHLALQLPTRSTATTGVTPLVNMIQQIDPHLATLAIAAFVLVLPGGCLALSLATGRTKALSRFAQWATTPGRAGERFALMTAPGLGPAAIAIIIAALAH